MQMGKDFRRRLEAVLRCPTAPFHEGNVHRVILDAVAASPRLRARTDALGNLEVTYGPRRPPLLFACHTDHPALEATGNGSAIVRGGIRPQALKGARLRLLDGSPARARRMQDALRRSGGAALAVSEAEIARAHTALARAGLDVEPTSAAALAGALQWQAADPDAARREIEAEGPPLMPLTGWGARAPIAARGHGGTP